MKKIIFYISTVIISLWGWKFLKLEPTEFDEDEGEEDRVIEQY